MPTDPTRIFPPLPKGFSLPFYYASIQAIWVYYKVDAAKLPSFLGDVALEPALFDGQGLVLLHFQRYTGFIANAISAVNEVQLNIIAYPRALARQSPAISFNDFLGGGEQTKTLGAYRLHVPVDNPFAARAGNELFYEPTFVTTFNYAVPDINDPLQDSWTVTCKDPDPARKSSIFTLQIDCPPPDTSISAMSPVMQYTRDPAGRLFAYTWNVFGVCRSAVLRSGPKLTIGSSSHPMRETLQKLLDGVSAAGVQFFETPPVGTSARGYLVQSES